MKIDQIAPVLRYDDHSTDQVQISFEFLDDISLTKKGKYLVTAKNIKQLLTLSMTPFGFRSGG